MGHPSLSKTALVLAVHEGLAAVVKGAASRLVDARDGVHLQEETVGLKDKSLGYSSYTFGDPAAPISRTYLGDPVKQRLVHGGSEVFHVHHVNCGAASEMV